jgi:hypothetical protein
MKKYLSVFLFLLFISTTALYLNQRLLSTLRFNKVCTADSTYYVATTGSDANPGTLSSPFQTIQKCASIATAGDTCLIRQGTYRETVTPANSGTAASPITFAPYNNEQVTISGADEVTGWTAHSGAIYKTQAMNWDLGPGKNQVLVDGVMMTEARWPNTGTDISRPTWATAQDGQSDDSHPFGSPVDPNERWSISDSALNQPAGFWNGALVNHKASNGWVTQSGIVTAYTPGKIEFQLLGNRYGVGPGTIYYLTGTMAALDTAGEWFSDGATLYLWAPAGDSPASHSVEVKRRQQAIDLSGKSSITIGAFAIVAAGIKTDMASRHLMIDGIKASYVSHVTRVEGQATAHWVGWDTGILLHGSDNTLQNCEIAYSAANGADLLGTNQTITNCTIHDVDYLAIDSGAVYTHSRGDTRTGAVDYPNQGHQITHNTLYNTGRSGIVHTKATGIKILYNHIYNVGLQSCDLGATYAVHSDGGGSEIAYNIIHDVKTIPNYSPSFANGIYLDDNSHDFLVHHNVIYNINSPFYASTGIVLHLAGSNNNQVYNNTIWNVQSENRDYDGGIQADGDSNVKVYNNLMNTPIQGANAGTDMQNNLSTSNPGFVDAANSDFHLQAGSPVIDQGRVIAGITGGFVGSAPDIGAYEYGGADWTAGANLTTTPAPGGGGDCHIYTPQTPLSTIPQGFGVPWNPLSSGQELLLKTKCETSTATGTHGQDLLYSDGELSGLVSKHLNK